MEKLPSLQGVEKCNCEDEDVSSSDAKISRDVMCFRDLEDVFYMNAKSTIQQLNRFHLKAVYGTRLSSM